MAATTVMKFVLYRAAAGSVSIPVVSRTAQLDVHELELLSARPRKRQPLFPYRGTSSIRKRPTFYPRGVRFLVSEVPLQWSVRLIKPMEEHCFAMAVLSMGGASGGGGERGQAPSLPRLGPVSLQSCRFVPRTQKINLRIFREPG